MNSQYVLCETQNSNYWFITLNRPDKRNALSDEVVVELLACVEQAKKAQIPALVFAGAGKNLSAGFDFSDIAHVSCAELLWRFVRVQQLLSAIQAYPGLTIAVAHGRNFGAGCDLFAACQMRLASAEARFRMPGVLFDLILGTRRFAQLVGGSHASRLLLSTTEFDCSEALRIGFVTHLLNEGAEQEAQCEQARQLGMRAQLEPLILGVASLSVQVRNDITQICTAQQAEQDMAHLVASVMQGNIKERLLRYLGK